MNIDPDLKREENFAKKKTFYSKCQAKDIKLSSFLGGNPRKILIFTVSLYWLNFMCLKFSFNFVLNFIL